MLVSHGFIIAAGCACVLRLVVRLTLPLESSSRKYFRRHVYILNKSFIDQAILMPYFVGPAIDTIHPTANHNSCQAILDHNNHASSGVYQIDLDGGTQDNAFRVYCDMDTEGGGWTLVWSYTFTDYDDFDDNSNAVTPRPNWPANSEVDVPVSTTPPQSEKDYNALNFSMWKHLGKQVLIKSNINNWLMCQPGTGSLVDWKTGSVSCQVIKRVTTKCQSTQGPTNIWISESDNSYGPMYGTSGKSGIYYYFDGSQSNDWPTHDPCALNQENNLRDVNSPHGNIFIR